MVEKAHNYENDFKGSFIQITCFYKIWNVGKYTEIWNKLCKTLLFELDNFVDLDT